jgi:O-antigen ligase
VYYLYQGFADLSGGGLADRFESVSESNRIDIFKVTLKMTFSSNILQFFFGHGWSMVVRDSPMKYSAHNDFLELFYDAGLVGLVLFLIFLVYLWRWYRILHKRRSSSAAPLLASYGVFLFGMLFSHIVIFPYYFVLLCATWGYIYGIESANQCGLQIKQ